MSAQRMIWCRDHRGAHGSRWGAASIAPRPALNLHMLVDAARSCLLPGLDPATDRVPRQEKGRPQGAARSLGRKRPRRAAGRRRHRCPAVPTLAVALQHATVQGRSSCIIQQTRAIQVRFHTMARRLCSRPSGFRSRDRRSLGRARFARLQAGEALVARPAQHSRHRLAHERHRLHRPALRRAKGFSSQVCANGG